MDLHYSQTVGRPPEASYCFTTLWIYTILKHVVTMDGRRHRFTTLWIYTILKREDRLPHPALCFTTLWIYTILKLVALVKRTKEVSLPYGFTLFSNKTAQKVCRGKFHYLMDLHYSQTAVGLRHWCLKFHYLMDLHYSQTDMGLTLSILSFTTLWIYTILKLRWSAAFGGYSFTTLWIYTILKRI